jgi:hypothetical protein
MASEEGEDLITQAEAARLRGVTRSAIAYLIAQGRLKTYKRFGVSFVSKSEVESYEPQKPGPRPTSKAKAEAAPSADGKVVVKPKSAAKKGGKK